MQKNLEWVKELLGPTQEEWVYILLADTLDQRDEQIFNLSDVITKIESWCDAYPVGIFREVEKEDWETVRKLLEPSGISLDRVAASNMRYVLSGIKEIIRRELDTHG